MNTGMALLLLLGAALLEAGGDAIVRVGLLGSAGVKRVLLFLAGGFVLWIYGTLVNSTRWDFGRLIGIYVIFFFLVAQAIDWLAFHHKPPLPVLAGGVLILAGGLVITFWKG